MRAQTKQPLRRETFAHVCAVGSHAGWRPLCRRYSVPGEAGRGQHSSGRPARFRLKVIFLKVPVPSHRKSWVRGVVKKMEVERRLQHSRRCVRALSPLAALPRQERGLSTARAACSCAVERAFLNLWQIPDRHCCTYLYSLYDSEPSARCHLQCRRVLAEHLERETGAAVLSHLPYFEW